MASPTSKATEQAVQTTLSLLQDLFGTSDLPPFAVRLWDGSMWQSKPNAGELVRFTLVLQHPGALRTMLLPPNVLNLGEAYIYNDFDIEGDIVAALLLGDQILDEQWGKMARVRFGKRLLGLPRIRQPRPAEIAAKLHGARHSKERDRQAMIYHYDRSNAFYALWLDQRMVYSCAYFVTPEDNLDTAQEHKLEYLCRKLCLRAGESLLDIGCGWGGLIMYAVQHYGVQAYGITLSQLQAEWAQQRIQEAGLTERCHVEVRDYRDMQKTQTFDKIVSVGMFEHVDAPLLPTYFQNTWRLLRPGGIFLNHGIASNMHDQDPYGVEFGNRYVFPDAGAVPISTTLRVAEESSFEVRDVESLREHYALTLGHWVRRLEAHAEEARQLTNEVFYRIWRLYMAAAIHTFQTGRSNIYQTLLAKPDHGNSRLPLTRTDWYA